MFYTPAAADAAVVEQAALEHDFIYFQLSPLHLRFMCFHNGKTAVAEHKQPEPSRESKK